MLKLTFQNPLPNGEINEGMIAMSEWQENLKAALTTYTITKVEYTCYDQHFVETFHPNYNCDQIAILDDAWCCQDNESGNICHWGMLADEICADDEEKYRCKRIYEGKEKPDFELGAMLAEKYADEIQKIIDGYEKDIMDDAVEGFLSYLKKQTQNREKQTS